MMKTYEHLGLRVLRRACRHDEAEKPRDPADLAAQAATASG